MKKRGSGAKKEIRYLIEIRCETWLDKQTLTKLFIESNKIEKYGRIGLCLTMNDKTAIFIKFNTEIGRDSIAKITKIQTEATRLNEIIDVDGGIKKIWIKRVCSKKGEWLF